uniref:Uncharacterized protein n=1 Tax=Arundo donax TaxID=35708 RepID=A0A0A8XY81_ARUDO
MWGRPLRFLLHLGRLSWIVRRRGDESDDRGRTGQQLRDVLPALVGLPPARPEP